MIQLLCLGALLAVADTSRAPLIDGFEHREVWSAHPADGVELALHSDRGRTGRALRLDFSFGNGGGYAIARRRLDLDLPPNYAFSFWLRGNAPVNTLEFKLVDRSGENVWWYTERDRNFAHGWQRITIRRRQIAFAWGPKGGGDLDHVAALELVITAGQGGGKGSVWFDDLTLTKLPDVVAVSAPPLAHATASSVGHPVAALLDGDSTTSWRAAGPWASVTIDFLHSREFGGLTLAWEAGRASRSYDILASDDGRLWRLLERRRRGIGWRDHLYLPDTEARFVRLDLRQPGGAQGFGLTAVVIEPLSRTASRNAFFAGIAGGALRGSYPRYLLGERADWTVAGVDAAREEALIDEDGAIEAGSGGFRIEPFLEIAGRLLSWGDVQRTVSLAQSRLPIPSVEWRAGDVSLSITAIAIGSDSASSVIARYRVRNTGSGPLRGTLYLAVRPFQVNPPWQFLGTPGGVGRIDSLSWNGSWLAVNSDRSVFPMSPPTTFGAAPFAAGDVAEYLRRGAVPPERSARDRFGAASGAFAWPLDIAPGDSATIALEVPLDPRGRPLLTGGGSRSVDSALAAAVSNWSRSVDRASITLPPVGAHLANTIASTIAYVLVNRDGAAIQPGSRSYERSWIRDGALTSAALLRFGHADAVRDFLLWYAPHQYPSGKIPCCVDRRGADPVPEHDSNGEFIYLVMEYYRHTGDRALLEEMWPHVAGATRYLDSLRQLSASDSLFRGILPPSISHEGYSAKPMHSYWDDFFALRGFKDATEMARILGRSAEADRIGGIRDDFARDLYASIALAMARHHIDFIPGSADLGDFDATSTTIAVSPGGELARLPREALERTFERYWLTTIARREPGSTWEAYTPYELRTVGTLIRLGWQQRALALLDGFLLDQEPMAWNQWPEIVWHERRAPKFIGDLPHTWVGSDFLRSAADLFAYERESDSTLVVGAGIPVAWLDADGVRVDNLHTWWGPISYTARRTGAVITIDIARGLRLPPGGLLVFLPGLTGGGRVTVAGEPVTPGPGGTVRVHAVPVRIDISP